MEKKYGWNNNQASYESYKSREFVQQSKERKGEEFRKKAIGMRNKNLKETKKRIFSKENLCRLWI